MQGATTNVLLRVPGYDVTGAESAVLSFRVKGKKYDFDLDRMLITYDGTDSVVYLIMRQEETLAMRDEVAEIQLRWRNADGNAYTTGMALQSIGEAIHKEEI